MSTTKSLTSQQSPQKPGFRKIMTWNIRKSNKKHPQLYTSDSAPGNTIIPIGHLKINVKMLKIIFFCLLLLLLLLEEYTYI